MKMYILVRDELPVGLAMVVVAHASLATYLKFQDNEDVKTWLAGTFYKVVCKVNATEFENAKQVPNHVVLTESTRGNQEVALGFCPRAEWPKMFKFFKLYRETPPIAVAKLPDSP
jgi:hypothetical protein